MVHASSFESEYCFPINPPTTSNLFPSPSYKRTDADVVTIYRACKVFRDAGLSRGDLLFLALLLGSDYDPVSVPLNLLLLSLTLMLFQTGLPRCGPGVARGLVKYGLGCSLYGALLSLHDDKLQSFLLGWRAQLRDKLHFDPSGYIGRRHPALAASVPSSFPDLKVAMLFLSPAVLHPDQYASLRDPQVMDLPHLALLCEQYFTWGSCTEILKVFRTSLWPGEAVRMFINEGLKAKGLDVQVSLYDLRGSRFFR